MIRFRFFYTLILISLILVGQSLAAIDLKTCVGMWLFDENSGDIAKDSSGKGNNGKLMNNPKWVKGKIGSALEFDGKDDWINIGDNAILKPSSDVTFMAWYYWVDGYYVLASGGQTSSTGYAITHEPKDDTIWFGVNTDKKAANTGYIQGTSRKTWHHLAGSYSDADGKLVAYVDGIPIKTVNTDLKPFNNQWPALHIGKPNNVDNYYIQGTIDEVAIFNVALTQNEINTIMTRGLEGSLAVFPSGKLAIKWGIIKTIP